MSPVQLPGGLWIDGQVHRLAYIAPLTGYIERTIAECTLGHLIQPRSVSVTIATAIERIGSIAVSEEIADQLSVGDRIYLMLQIASRYLSDCVWLSPKCSHCHSLFDVPIYRSKLEVILPSEEYPLGVLKLADYELEVRSPNGKDQCLVVEAQPDDAEGYVLGRCIKSINGKTPDSKLIQNLLYSYREDIELAVESVSPLVDCGISVKCPECDFTQSIELEPYWLGELTKDNIYAEIHTIAFHYHWLESEILNLTRNMRLRYCSLINSQTRGLGQ